MAYIGAGDLRERVQVRRLVYDEDTDTWEWATDWGTWAKAEQSDRTCIFSTVGIGARSVTFTLRKNALVTLDHAFLWRGHFCFLASLTDGPRPGLMEVKAALCETAKCRKDVDRSPAGCRFPGVLTEKYLRHEQERPQSSTETVLVLVTPKVIELAAGSLVEAGGRDYEVRVCHTLDPHKNEYEIARKADC